MKHTSLLEPQSGPVTIKVTTLTNTQRCSTIATSDTNVKTKYAQDKTPREYWRFRARYVINDFKTKKISEDRMRKGQRVIDIPTSTAASARTQ